MRWRRFSAPSTKSGEVRRGVDYGDVKKGNRIEGEVNVSPPSVMLYRSVGNCQLHERHLTLSDT